MELAAPVTTSIALHHFTAWANYEEVWIRSSIGLAWHQGLLTMYARWNLALSRANGAPP